MLPAMLLGLWAAGCVQRAVLLPVSVPKLTALASTMTRSVRRSAVIAEGPKDDSAPRQGAPQRFLLHAETSKLEVRGGDLLTGNHVMKFKRWRGAFLKDATSPPEKPTGELTIDIELGSLETDWIVDDSLRNHLLEVNKHPRAIFAGTVRPRDDNEPGHVFLGRLVVHGVERSIRFYLTVKPAAETYLLDAVFDMSRDEFGMHRKDTIDLVIYDDFRVDFGLVAHPEQVSAEIVPVR